MYKIYKIYQICIMEIWYIIKNESLDIYRFLFSKKICLKCSFVFLVWRERERERERETGAFVRVPGKRRTLWNRSVPARRPRRPLSRTDPWGRPAKTPRRNRTFVLFIFLGTAHQASMTCFFFSHHRWGFRSFGTSFGCQPRGQAQGGTGPTSGAAFGYLLRDQTRRGAKTDLWGSIW